MPRPAPPAATLPWRGALSFLIIGVAALAMSVLTTAIRANPATTTGPDYSDLVLSLTFDGDSGSTVVDSSKYQHNGTATGTTVTDGKFGNGRSFNGTSDYLVIPHADPLSPTSAITVEAWVYLDTTNTAMKILQKRGVFSDTSGGYMLGAWFGNPRGYAFEVYDSNQHIVYPSPENSPPTQIWTHVAATFDGSAIKLYKDGAIQNTVAWSGALTRSTKDLWIGMQPDNSLMPFKGKMDEIRIYNRALSAEEVSCSYEGKVWLSGSCQASSSNRPPAVVSMVGPTTATAGIQQTWTVKVHDPDTGRLTYDVDWGESGVAHSTEAVPSPQLTNNSQTFSHVYQTAGTFTPRVTVTDPSGVTASLSASSVTVAAPADTQAPGISTNLVAEETTITSTRIAWLAPSDNVGVTSYQVRYRQGISFADVDWLGATDAGTVPSTVAAGQRVSTVLSNLAAGTDYGVGVKACDAASNCSTIAAMQFRTGASVGEDGLLGHWKFDGNGTNEIAGGPSAATAGNAAFRSSGGKLVGYAYLSATGDSVRIPNRSTFDLPNTFTVALWFRQRADRGFLQDLVLKGAGQNNYSFRVFRQLWNQYNFGPIITGYTSSRTGYWTQTSNPNQLSHNEWHHVVFTKDATQSAYYLDGSLIHSSQQTDPAVMTTEDIVVGGTAVDTDVDDLRIYNRALSATEARELGGFPALDTQAPGIPTYVLAEETTATSTRIAWLASSDNVGVTSYEVRYRQGTSFASVDWAGATATSAIPSTVAAGQRVSTVLSGLAANTDYAAGVKACDAANNCSTIAAATFRTLGTTSGGADTQPPQAPTDLTVTSVAQTEIGLRWSVPSDNVGVAKFSIRKKTGTTAFTEVEWATAPLIAEIPSTERIVGTVLFTPLTGFTQNTQYVVGMKACDAAGNCSPTASVPFRTVEDAAGAHADTQPPTPPGSPAMSAITTTEATVTWSPATDAVGVARYEIRYRVGPVFAEADWASANGSVGVVWASTGQRSHLLSGLTSGTQYTAAIKAYDAAGNESPLASVTFRASGTTSTTTTTTGTTTTTTTTGTGTTTSGGGGGGGGGTTTTGTTTGTTSTTTTTTGTATLLTSSGSQ